jgi:isopentenyl-diphosphate Delta-isomerase
VVEQDEVYVRSLRGGAGRWYRELTANPDAVLHAGSDSVPVRAVPAADPESIERATAGFRRKYAGSPSLESMIRDEILDTTVRLEPGSSSHIAGAANPAACWPVPDVMALTDAREAGQGRKDDHLRIAAEVGVEHRAGTGLERIRLRHRALPERDLASVQLGIELLARPLAAPLVVSAMTGGTTEAAAVNERLAGAAAELGVAMVLGSGRALLEDPGLLGTYRLGPRPPLLLGNLGAAQITPERAVRLVELLEADGLSVHLNPLQEAVQPEGEPQFSGVVERIAATVERLTPLPVVVKEVGFGLDAGDVRALDAAGVAALDVAGSGGTNWALIEGRRDARSRALAEAFADWGTPTLESLRAARAAAPDATLLASGGLRDGVDVAKCLALGARACGIARPLLLAARSDRLTEALGTVVEQLRIATWLAGAPSATALDESHLQ